MKTSRCPRLKKWIKRLAFALVALVTLTALVLAIEGYRAKRAWDAFERELAARGESLDWQTHVGFSAPDDQNLLATPLLATCFGFALEADTSDERPGWAEACETLAHISDWTLQLSGPGGWREGTVVPLTEWQTKLRSTDDRRPCPIPGDSRRTGAPVPVPHTTRPSQRRAVALPVRRSRPLHPLLRGVERKGRWRCGSRANPWILRATRAVRRLGVAQSSGRDP